MSIWQGMVQELKRTQMISVRKCFANTKAKPNSRVAALVEEESRKMHLNSLLPSTGTLIVVPSVLLEHWKVCDIFQQTKCLLKSTDCLSLKFIAELFVTAGTNKSTRGLSLLDR